MAKKPVIFISHVHEEASLATAVSQLVSEVLLDGVSFFVSSDHRSIRAGDDWLQKIRGALSDACIVLVIVGPQSIGRTWVNFESGAGWLSRRVIPLCHSGLRPSQLPQPLGSLYGLSVGSPDDLRELCSVVAEAAGLRPPAHDWHGATALLEQCLRVPEGVRPEGAADCWVFPNSDNTRTVDSLGASLQRCKIAKFCSIGLNFLWGSEPMLTMTNRIARGELSVQVCMGQFNSKSVRLRLAEEGEILAGVPQGEYLIRRLVHLEKTVSDDSRFAIKLFDHYPTYAMLIFDNEVYVYPYGFRVLGNSSPTFYLPSGDPAAQFFKQQFDTIFAGAKPARNFYKFEQALTVRGKI